MTDSRAEHAVALVPDLDAECVSITIADLPIDNHYGDFRLAVRNRTKETTYFPVRGFGKLVESVTHIEKGTKVFVDGELEAALFTGEDGNKHMTFRMVANTYRILAQGRRGRREESHAEPDK